MSIYFAKFRFSLRLLTDVTLPSYLGATLRGGFGHVFKRIVCIINEEQNRKCEQCLLRGTCVYSYCFETPTSRDGALSYSSSHYPHPFVIDPPLQPPGSTVQDGCMVFSLVLVGKALDYLPHFILVFDELGRSGIGRERGEYVLETVEAMASVGDGQYKPIYDWRMRSISSSPASITFADVVDETRGYSGRTLTIDFLTPTRIKHKGRLQGSIEFAVLARSLVRRFSLLSEMHCGSALGLDYRQIIARAERVQTLRSSLYWHDLERYSSRQQRWIKFGGFMGSIMFEGDLREFMPLLKLGEYLHVGKDTGFGLGQYHIRGQGLE